MFAFCACLAFSLPHRPMLTTTTTMRSFCAVLVAVAVRVKEREREEDTWVNEMVKLTLMSSFWAYWLRRLQLAIDLFGCHLHVNIYTWLPVKWGLHQCSWLWLYLCVCACVSACLSTYAYATLPQPFLIKLKCSPAKSRASHNETGQRGRPQNVAATATATSCVTFWRSE